MNGVAKALKAFGAFWWDFIVGEDWRIALGIVLAISLTAGLAHNDVPAWWVLPVAVILMLGASLSSAVRNRD
jgi:hypothetical protein